MSGFANIRRVVLQKWGTRIYMQKRPLKPNMSSSVLNSSQEIVPTWCPSNNTLPKESLGNRSSNRVQHLSTNLPKQLSRAMLKQAGGIDFLLYSAHCFLLHFAQLTGLFFLQPAVEFETAETHKSRLAKMIKTEHPTKRWRAWIYALLWPLALFHLCICSKPSLKGRGVWKGNDAGLSLADWRWPNSFPKRFRLLAKGSVIW